MSSIAPEKNKPVSVYPNPTENIWNFDLANAGSAVTVEIIDITGKIVLSKNLAPQNCAVDASGISKGVYFAKITSGLVMQAVKVIKE